MKVLKWILGIVAVAAVLFGVALVYMNMQAKQILAKTYSVDPKDVPIPWPLTEQEIQQIKAERAPQPVEPPPDPAVAAGAAVVELSPEEITKIARERAVERGKRLVTSRLGCTECHGNDFGGGVIIDNPVVVTWVAPNITGSGRIKGFTGKDWVRILRHGVNKSGTGSTMPAIDYTWLSDQEISDIASYVQSFPPVERSLPETKLGPVFSMLYATGKIKPAAEMIDQKSPRLVVPPESKVSMEFGKHLLQTCVGCHFTNFSGGKRPDHDPKWPPVANLTPHESGLKGWAKDDWFRALREGKSKGGRSLSPVMPWQFTKNLSDVELEAMWLYVQSLPPLPIGAP